MQIKTIHKKMELEIPQDNKTNFLKSFDTHQTELGIITGGDIQKILKISHVTLLQWRRNGLKFSKVGNKIFYRKTDILNYIGL